MNITEQLNWNFRYAVRRYSQQPQGHIHGVTLLGTNVTWDETGKTAIQIPKQEIEKLAHSVGIADDAQNILKPGFSIAVARTIEEIPARANDDNHMLMISHLSEFNAAAYQEIVSKVKPGRLAISSENGTEMINFPGYKDIGPASVNGTTVRHLKRADLIPSL